MLKFLVRRYQKKWPGTLETLVEILKDLKDWEDDFVCDYVKVEIVYGEARYEIT